MGQLEVAHKIVTTKKWQKWVFGARGDARSGDTLPVAMLSDDGPPR
ncbi:MAG: hypothetical protein N2F24_20020 [Deltaproteobacteria bacterium]